MAFILDSESLDWRVDISIDNTKIDATLTNKDIKVDLSLFGASFWNNVKSDGGDIRASLTDGTTRLALGVYNIDTVGETGYIRIKVPSISSSADTKIYIYWGNAALSQPAASSTYGSENVWDANYVYVLNFEQDPSGGAPQATDITGNGYNFTSQGTMTSGDLVTAINGSKGWDLDGTDDLARISNSGAINFKSTADWTIESFHNCDPSAATTFFILSAQYDSANPTPEYFQLRWNATGDLLAAVGGDLAAGQFVLTGTTASSSLAWYHAAFTHESGSPANLKLYLDGSLEDSDTYSTAWDASNDSSYVTHGSYYNSATPQHPLDGIKDEVRFSNVVRSVAWLNATHENLKDLANFYSIGSYEQTTGGRSYAHTGVVAVS